MEHQALFTWNIKTYSHGISRLIHMEYQDLFTWNSKPNLHGIASLIPSQMIVLTVLCFQYMDQTIVYKKNFQKPCFIQTNDILFTHCKMFAISNVMSHNYDITYPHCIGSNLETNLKFWTFFLNKTAFFDH